MTERDWVVVGATRAQMHARGFKQVGRDFPVFLHPCTGEQYALARTERTTGPGHGDFVCDAIPVSRWKRISAVGTSPSTPSPKDQDGRLIDPYGGRDDVANRVLRHISAAFAEDPLRVFRVARFAAQLPDFRIADETMKLMAAMAPELAALSGERVGREFEKAAAAPRPVRFFEVVHALGGTCWFDALDLPATIDLLRSRSFPRPDVVLAAVGWTNSKADVASAYGRLRARRLVQRAASALAAHGRTLVSTPVPAARLLDALTAIGAFRQGETASLVVDAAECCAGASLAPAAATRRRAAQGEGLRRRRGPTTAKPCAGRRIARIESRAGAAAGLDPADSGWRSVQRGSVGTAVTRSSASAPGRRWQVVRAAPACSRSVPA